MKSNYSSHLDLVFCISYSQVKAESNSKKLSQLKEASKHVNEATAQVVASTKDGKAQVEEGGEEKQIISSWMADRLCFF